MFSYLGPFVLTFFIAVFILLMQFVWKYVDDLVGKGLEWYVIAELLLYTSASIVPLALPLAILMSSLMTFGNLGEHYELIAMKSAGISLQRIMAPVVLLSVLISIGAFFFSNNVMPKANLQMGSLLYDVRQQRPALSIKEGVFYNGIDGYSIKVASKGKDGKMLYDIMIYDHTQGTGNNKLITASSGNMVMSDDKHFLILTLFSGFSYEEMQSRKTDGTHPFLRSEFKEQVVRLDLSGFKFIRTDQDLFRDNYQMLNLAQLDSAADSLTSRLELQKKDVANNFAPYLCFRKDTSYMGSNMPSVSALKKDLLSNFPSKDRIRIVEGALNMARSASTYINNAQEDLDMREKTIIRHTIEWHRKFTLSFACFVLFFIGAPLGAIIRKGGLGMPVFMSTIFFVMFHLMSLTGEKFAREGLTSPIYGMWFASGVLLPLGVFFTYKATKDSSMFDLTSYLSFFKKLIPRFSKIIPTDI